MLQQRIEMIKKSVKQAEQEHLSLDKVINAIKKAIKKNDKECAEFIDTNFKRIKEVIPNFLPHYVDNKGLHVCDWVEFKDADKVKTVCKSYMFTLADGEEFMPADKVTGEIVCRTAIIEKTLKKAEKLILEDELGNTYVVSKKDEEGKCVKSDMDVQLCPRNKTTFGFTDDMVNALVATIDHVEKELAEAIEA
jgi:nucleoid DNA-binding protein